MADSGLTIIRCAIPGTSADVIPLQVDRWTLAKTRWRGKAGDGREFGFDLAHPLKHGDQFADRYVIQQQPEKVLVAMARDAQEAATLAWAIGNLHQSLQVAQNELIAADEESVRNLLTNRHVSYRVEDRIFQPLQATAHSHHHHA